jgi:TonB family protein
MAKFRKGSILLLVLSTLAIGQEKAVRLPRIICTPPTMKILKMVRPTFPPEAKGKNIYGTVVVDAQIDKTGRPSTVKLVKGDSVLAAAVITAVEKWRWKPLNLNGEPVEVVTTISINFEPR